MAFEKRTLRDALVSTTESVAVAIHVENWSAYRLWEPEFEMENGRTYNEEAAKKAGTLQGKLFFLYKLKIQLDIYSSIIICTMT